MLFAYLLSGERSEKTFQPLKRFFLVVLSHWQCFFEVWKRKAFQPAKRFFSHRHITVAPKHLAEGWGGSMPRGFACDDGAVTLRMAMRMPQVTGYFLRHHSWWVCSARWMAPFLLPFASSHLPAHDRSPPACAHECAALCFIAQLHAAGNGNIPYAKPVAGRMPSILQSILIQNGDEGGIRGHKAFPRPF